VLGVVPAALGTYAFAIFMVGLAILGWREYDRLGAAGGYPADTAVLILGSLAILVFGIVALYDLGALGLLLSVSIATFSPVVVSLSRRPIPAFGSFQSATFGVLYLGIPVFSAVELRGLPGDASQAWFTNFASNSAWIGAPAPTGLAIVMSVILAVWLGDTVAYLAGSALGCRKLAPHISPGKTIEGSAAGLVAAIVTGAIAYVAFGAGTWQAGAALGTIVGVAGQLGDLAESLMKRQAGVKDSGTLLPGHGGILDRIDALLFALPAALLTVHALNWLEH
jgi:phosphatidate cytidylyltransferase